MIIVASIHCFTCFNRIKTLLIKICLLQVYYLFDHAFIHAMDMHLPTCTMQRIPATVKACSSVVMFSVGMFYGFVHSKEFLEYTHVPTLESRSAYTTQIWRTIVG